MATACSIGWLSFNDITNQDSSVQNKLANFVAYIAFVKTRANNKVLVKVFYNNQALSDIDITDTWDYAYGPSYVPDSFTPNTNKQPLAADKAQAVAQRIIGRINTNEYTVLGYVADDSYDPFSTIKGTIRQVDELDNVSAVMRALNQMGKTVHASMSIANTDFDQYIGRLSRKFYENDPATLASSDFFTYAQPNLRGYWDYHSQTVERFFGHVEHTDEVPNYAKLGFAFGDILNYTQINYGHHLTYLSNLPHSDTFGFGGKSVTRLYYLDFFKDNNLYYVDFPKEASFLEYYDTASDELDTNAPHAHMNMDFLTANLCDYDFPPINTRLNSLQTQYNSITADINRLDNVISSTRTLAIITLFIFAAVSIALMILLFLRT